MRKTEKYICIFCVVAGFVAAYVIGYRYGNSDKDKDIVLREEIKNDMPYISENVTSGNNNSMNVASQREVLGTDSKLVLETSYEHDKLNITSVESDIPIELVGYNREQVVKYLEENGDLFLEQNEELINIMLVSFSKDKVVVRKNVKEGKVIIYTNGDSERYNYYIGFKEDKVVVFKKDKETVFIETGITYDMVERETRENIEEGVWIENISALYRYLESITS